MTSCEVNTPPSQGRRRVTGGQETEKDARSLRQIRLYSLLPKAATQTGRHPCISQHRRTHWQAGELKAKTPTTRDHVSDLKANFISNLHKSGSLTECCITASS